MALAFVLVFGATVTALPDISLAMVLGIVSGGLTSMKRSSLGKRFGLAEHAYSNG